MQKLNPLLETLINDLHGVPEEDRLTALRIIECAVVAAAVVLNEAIEDPDDPHKLSAKMASKRLGEYRRGLTTYPEKKLQLEALMKSVAETGSYAAATKAGMPMNSQLRRTKAGWVYNPEDALDPQIQYDIKERYLLGEGSHYIIADYPILTVHNVLYYHCREEIETRLEEAKSFP